MYDFIRYIYKYYFFIFVSIDANYVYILIYLRIEEIYSNSKRTTASNEN